MQRFITAVIFFLLLSLTSFSQVDEDMLLRDFFKKDSVKILVTDSGLGGLSIAADLYEKLKATGIFENVDIVFFNAQPHLKSGYNSLKTREHKVWVFDNALKTMEEKFHPDMILIGCNTLSVLYESTKYSKNVKIPVYGIVDAGVNLIEEKANKDSEIIIFATKTTVSEGKHKSNLVADGYSEDKIIAVPCPKLAGAIERGFQSSKTDSLVNLYVQKSINMLNDSKTSDNLFVSYNCTHYGYVDNLFKNTFKKYAVTVSDFLDPNIYMTKFFFTEENLNRLKKTKVSISVYSQAELTEGKLNSINTLIKRTSTETASALMNYTLNPDYFKWTKEEMEAEL